VVDFVGKAGEAAREVVAGEAARLPAGVVLALWLLLLSPKRARAAAALSACFGGEVVAAALGMPTGGLGAAAAVVEKELDKDRGGGDATAAETRDAVAGDAAPADRAV
jgi:hypothetical protein